MPPEPLIFAAMHSEAKIVRRALGFATPVRVIGIGARHLPMVDEARAAGGIILAGFAGALDPTLKAGDVVLDAPPGDYIGLRRGRLTGSPALVGTPAEKARLFAESGASAVDMECDAVRALAQEADVPFIGLRAISDTAQESIDPAILRFVDPFGRVRPLRLLTTLCRRPGLIPQLLRLGKSTRIAGEHLGMALRQLMKI